MQKGLQICLPNRFLFLLSLAISSVSLAQKRKHDTIPTPPNSAVTADEITKNAGVGSTEAYASAGVLELGGTANLTLASGLTRFGLAPRVGWFFADNLELSGILNWNYAKTSGTGNHILSFLAEPSYHYPLTKVDFVFLGLGLGFSYQSAPSSGGFALAPRAGYQRLVGRSGLLTADIQTTYSANDVIQTANGALLTVQTATSIDVGFGVLW